MLWLKMLKFTPFVQNKPFFACKKQLAVLRNTTNKDAAATKQFILQNQSIRTSNIGIAQEYIFEFFVTF